MFNTFLICDIRFVITDCLSWMFLNEDCNSTGLEMLVPHKNQCSARRIFASNVKNYYKSLLTAKLPSFTVNQAHCSNASTSFYDSVASDTAYRRRIRTCLMVAMLTFKILDQAPISFNHTYAYKLPLPPVQTFPTMPFPRSRIILMSPRLSNVIKTTVWVFFLYAIILSSSSVNLFPSSLFL